MRERLMRWTFFTAAVFVVVMACLPETPQLPGNPLNQPLRLLAFVVLTGLVCAAFPSATAGQILLSLGGLGGTIEMIQAIPELGREATIEDRGIDMAAIVAALAVRELLKRAMRRSQSEMVQVEP